MFEEYKALFRQADEQRRSGKPLTMEDLRRGVRLNELYNNHLTAEERKQCEELHCCPGHRKTMHVSVSEGRHAGQTMEVHITTGNFNLHFIETMGGEGWTLKVNASERATQCTLADLAGFIGDEECLTVAVGTSVDPHHRIVAVAPNPPEAAWRRQNAKQRIEDAIERLGPVGVVSLFTDESRADSTKDMDRCEFIIRLRTAPHCCYTFKEIAEALHIDYQAARTYAMLDKLGPADKRKMRLGRLKMPGAIRKLMPRQRGDQPIAR